MIHSVLWDIRGIKVLFSVIAYSVKPVRASGSREVSGCPRPTPDPGAGGCCACPGHRGCPGRGQDAGTRGTAAAGTAFMAAEQGEVEGRAVQNALGSEGLQTGNPARREPLHLSSARDQPCPPAEQRWVTLAARTQRPPSPGSPCCWDSSARSPEPPLTNRLRRIPLGWLHSFWAQIPDKGTVAVPHSVQRHMGDRRW